MAIEAPLGEYPPQRALRADVDAFVRKPGNDLLWAQIAALRGVCQPHDLVLLSLGQLMRWRSIRSPSTIARPVLPTL
jgi:hypothetical protein